MPDCRTCRHNNYFGTGIKGWVDCGHPVTLDKTPRHVKGDPAMVDYRTGDVPVSQIHNLRDCPTYEAGDVAAVSPEARSAGGTP